MMDFDHRPAILMFVDIKGAGARPRRFAERAGSGSPAVRRAALAWRGWSGRLRRLLSSSANHRFEAPRDIVERLVLKKSRPAVPSAPFQFVEQIAACAFHELVKHPFGADEENRMAAIDFAGARRRPLFSDAGREQNRPDSLELGQDVEWIGG